MYERLRIAQKWPFVNLFCTQFPCKLAKICYYSPVMSEIIEGKRIAQNLLESAKAKIEKFEHPLGLAAILVGNDPASRLYVGLKEKAAKEVGIYFEKIRLPEKSKTADIIKKIKELNTRDDIHGILVQLPLPNHDEDKVIASIDPKKDVDGFHKVNREKLLAGEKSIVPPVALAIMKLIVATNQPLSGKHAVVVGNNPIFAEPIIALTKKEGIETDFVSASAGGLASKICTADIVVVAVGQLDFLTRDMVKEGAIVIDVGTNKKDGHSVGDSAPNLMHHAGFISPVPGGVGPLTVAYLLMNVIDSAGKN